MRKIINGKLYDTDNLERLVYLPSVYDCGWGINLGVTPSGTFVLFHICNSSHCQNWIEPIEKDEVLRRIEGWTLTEREVENLKKYFSHLGDDV